MARVVTTDKDFNILLQDNVEYTGNSWELVDKTIPGTIIFERNLNLCSEWLDFSYVGDTENIVVSSRSSSNGTVWSSWCENLTAPVNNILQIRFVLSAIEETYENYND